MKCKIVLIYGLIFLISYSSFSQDSIPEKFRADAGADFVSSYIWRGI
ncbi:MAG: hypothetical protein HC906_17225 [Bacteroidales bacterium]|nr:hypothetical protein [Bacteroidales bacterium]